VWLVVVAVRPTMDTDANVYHLPQSLLMNHSVWYPGIAKLSLPFGISNGDSVLASNFTAFGKIGFENIPNLIIWIIFSLGIFIYLKRKEISTFNSLSLTFMFMLTPILFWQSYNMGTDLPYICFAVFGLLAFSEQYFDDTALFFALASVFKTHGLILFVMFMPYIFLRHIKEKKPWLFNTKIILAFFLIAIVFLRTFIATGNPFFPVFVYNFGNWSIDIGVQRMFIDSLRAYSGAERTLSGFLLFIKDFLFFPKRVMSSYWFSPFFLSASITALIFFITKKYYRKVNSVFLYLTFIIIIYGVIWFISSPLERFIAAILIFLTIKSFIFISKAKLPNFFILVNYAMLYSCLFLFIINAIVHIKKDVSPLINVSQETIDKFRDYTDGIILRKTEDGFIYSKTISTYVGRTQPPCVTSYAAGREEDLIREFRKYNKLYEKTR
jgi:hypothetical protein